MSNKKNPSINEEAKIRFEKARAEFPESFRRNYMTLSVVVYGGELPKSLVIKIRKTASKSVDRGYEEAADLFEKMAEFCKTHKIK